MEIILVRHGEVREKEDPHLTKLGRIQVMKLARRLKKEKIDKIYSSDLKRTIQTARIIGKEINKEVEFTSLIREIPDEIIEKYKKDWKNKETNKERLNEIKNFLKELEKNYKNKTVLIVAHAKLNRAIMSILTGINLYNIYSLKQDHACINILRKEKMGGRSEDKTFWKIILLNSVEHLHKEIRTYINKR